jgi:hypothetical protein
VFFYQKITLWNEIKKSYPILYFDATGGVFRNVRNQRQPHLFSMIAHDRVKQQVVPIFEFISASYDAFHISQYLQAFRYAVENYNKSLDVVVPIIVTDQSYA